MTINLASVSLAIVSLLCSASAAAFTQPTPEQFQGYLHKEVETGRGYVVAPFYPGDTTQKLATAMLDALWTEKSYRENMTSWLATNRADTMEDLVMNWDRHYHQAFHGIYEFLDEDTKSIMWRLSDWNAIYAMNREDCQTKTPEQVGQFIRSAHQALLADNWQKLAKDLPKALDREFARENAPKPGDRPIPEFMSKVALASLRATANTLPPEDGKRLIDQYSYQANKDKSPQQMCEMAWVVSHAVNDSKVDNSKEQVSGGLMRSTLTQTRYDEGFQRLDTPPGANRPKPEGFTPGKAVIYYPPIVITNNIHGDATYKLSIDASGKVVDVALSANTVQPEKVTSVDGNTYVTADLLLKVVGTYFREGSFTPKMVDGKATAYQAELPLHWQVK